MHYEFIIIGSGLGGLQCAYRLTKQGYKVLVLEKEPQPGGCLQTFRRAGAEFDTGFHYVGGLEQGQPLHQLFEQYDLMSLPWQKMDAEFDHVYIGDNHYAFAQGYDAFIDRMSQDFPHERDNLFNFTALLREVGEHTFDAFNRRSTDEFYAQSLFARSAYQYLNSTIIDPQLRKVLSATSLKMQLDADTLPLYLFAQINSSFIQSAYRLRGGGRMIADALTAKIRTMGGEVRLNSPVTELIEHDKQITEVVINTGERFFCDYVISNIHPNATLSLIKESESIRKVYRSRINRLQNSMGAFTVNIKLKPEAMRYRNHNIFIHTEQVDLWRYQSNPQPQQLMVSWSVPRVNSVWAETIDLITPMSFAEVAEWSDSHFGYRPEAYKEFKARKAEQLIQFAAQYLPELPAAIDRIYISTPLTYMHYTATHEGSAYGIMKDYNNPMTTILTPRTPIPNLLLTGQNLNLHGILGVSMTTELTLRQISTK